jgi:hypothetical protein
LISLAVVIGGAGLDCSNEAYDVFRQEAAGDIGEGVKSIVNGFLDGVIAILSYSEDAAGTN